MSCNTTYTFTPGTYSGALAPAALTNDEPGTAIGLTVNPSPCTGFCGTYYSSKNATASAGIATCGAGTPGTPNDDVWFTFVASTSQQTITVRGGAGYNPVVQLFSDAGITPLNCVNATGAGLTETINATGLTPAATYYVRVYHETAGSSSTPTLGTTTAAAGAGDFSICVNEIVPPPANDDICGAVNLSVGTSCSATAGSTVNSTASAQAVCGGTADDDVWYSFTASTATDVITVQSGAGFNAHFQVWSSSDNTCTGTLTSVTCVNNTSTAGTETFTGTSFVPGNVYFIRIYHSASGTGTGAFTVCVTAAPPACIGNPTTPANGGTACEAVPVTLTWPAASGATSYNIVLDGGAPINQAGTSYNAGVLALGGHTWSVFPVNNAGAATGCNTWTFSVESQPVIGTISGPSALFTAQSGSFSETGGTGGTLQWQSATVTGGPYSNIATATGNPQNISFASPGTYYIVATRTVGGCTVVTSNELTVVVSVQGDTPCAPIALVVGSNWAILKCRCCD
ncbi:hypothetical protein [Flavobacterium sp. 3HN19-14]|uniref:hypothetical protein n=1 Tax=Flavobacterium sp. 3HN19-14 TaxID=3448133 RepID=UPI003EE17C16